jgi:hypothetical protein
MYVTLYHGGQYSKEYRLTGVFHKLQFSPSPMLTEDRLTENGRMIFDNLVACNGRTIRDRR